MGRIKRGGGDGGEPARSPLGRPEFSPAAWPFVAASDFGRVGYWLGTPALTSPLRFETTSNFNRLSRKFDCPRSTTRIACP